MAPPKPAQGRTGPPDSGPNPPYLPDQPIPQTAVGESPNAAGRPLDAWGRPRNRVGRPRNSVFRPSTPVGTSPNPLPGDNIFSPVQSSSAPLPGSPLQRSFFANGPLLGNTPGNTASPALTWLPPTTGSVPITLMPSMPGSTALAAPGLPPPAGSPYLPTGYLPASLPPAGFPPAGFPPAGLPLTGIPNAGPPLPVVRPMGPPPAGLPPTGHTSGHPSPAHVWPPTTPPQHPAPPFNPYYPYAYVEDIEEEARNQQALEDRIEYLSDWINVIDYLAKKGYYRTEAMLRAESANQELPKDTEAKPTPAGPPRYFEFFSRMRAWTDDVLDTYKPEVKRLLWPMFVYSYLDLVKLFYPKEAQRLFQKFSDDFKPEHEYDLRGIQFMTLPEHGEEKIGKLYSENRYRLYLTHHAFTAFMSFLESLPDTGFKLMLAIIQDHLDIREVDRASDDRFSFASVISRGKEGNDMPAEDEGIPGHRPGNAISSTDPNVGNNLATLKLGKLPLEKDLEEDLRGDLMDLDLEVETKAGRESLIQTHERLNIKQEDDDEGPTRNEIPYPPSTARDVAIEVMKVREVRDRVKIESRTGGVGPAVSVVMYTFHNTKDSITCMDISGDSNFVAAGFYQSVIRIWSMDGKPFGPEVGGQKQNNHRLIGHTGPVFSVSFAPAAYRADPKPDPLAAQTHARWLLSSSGDGSIRLWSLDAMAQIVHYRGHVGPVWDVRWGPFGHYFASCGADRTARIWQTDKIKVVRLLAGHDDDVDCVAWHPNSSYVFSASSDKTVRMWAVTNGNPVRMFTGHTATITALACSRDGKLLASADETGVILVWDLAPGRLLKKLRGHGKGGIWSLTWSVESNVLVSGGQDCTVRAWDIAGPAKEAAAAPASGKADGAGSVGAGGAAATAATAAGKADGANNVGGGGNAAPPSSINLASSASGGVGVGAGAGNGATAGGMGGSTASGHKKRGKEAGVSNDQISAFLTKQSPVYLTKFTNMNLVLAAGAYLPEQAK
ncbi:transcription initiation factor TFIID subunit 5 [Capronia coronata CBS 617.96]|uniref:Transcription initiation factor TFIID subunit 5 n=1 Tax=Capronia coronata CBS 617.96 TaxID=1182541 RepID=W9ZGB9_9EURO|nr:transcription initiation factor TFIID subunit 5 [Capronia coronata CBS 617.96]EXJ93544.1 transcription initiation factor TFIID subunit 5 [Capronia coronata CBS 617.96]